MNNRIKKKQMKLKPIKVGNTTYDRKSISEFNKLRIGFINIRYLYSKIKPPLPKWSRARTSGLMNYIYKNRIRSYKTHKTKTHRRFVTSRDIYEYRKTFNHVKL